MLLFIDDSFVQDIYRKKRKAIEAIDLIAFGRICGNHFVLAKRNSLKLIRDNNDVNEKTKKVFSYIFENYPIYASIKDKISYYIKIISGERHMKLHIHDETQICEASYDYFQDFEIMSKTSILAENIDDIRFYKKIADYYKNKNNLSSLKIDYNSRMGGGGTTYQAYSTFQNEENTFCLCFVDSDKKYPNANNGETLKKIIENNDNTKLFTQYHSLKAREVENLIPLNILEQVTQNSEDHKTGYKTLYKIAQSENKRDLQFIDIKKGISIKKYKEINDNQLKNFINNLCNKSNILTQSELDSINNSSNTPSNQTNIIQGLGRDILNKTIEYLENNKTEPIFDYPEQQEEWNEVGQIFVNWTCCGEKIYY